ncbi:MAG: polysaccharide deacetylase family protein [Pirellulaceae bacterium]
MSITFDDGYSENADFAIPELVQRKLTATYFVSTDFVRTGASFPHDLEAGTALAPNTIATARIRGARYRNRSRTLDACGSGAGPGRWADRRRNLGERP